MLKSLSFRVLFLSFFAGLLVPAGVFADWPTWQHDNRRTGATEEQLKVESLVPDWVWTSPTPPDTAWSGPAKWDAYAFHRKLPSMRNYDPVFHAIAVGDRVWFGSSADDTLYCLNATTGKVLWKVTVDGPIRLAPTWAKGRVYFGSDDGYARCVDAETGELIWQHRPADTDRLILNNGRFIPFQPCRTGVVVDGGTAWFACALLPWEDSWLCSLDAASGELSGDGHYVKKLPGRTMEGAPALSSKFLVLPQGRVAPQVFDRQTGKDLGAMVKSGGGSVVVVALDESIVHGPATDSRKGGFRESSGKTREVVAGLGQGNALVVEGATSWMLTDTEIIASSLTKRKVLWKTACECPYTMVKSGDVLYVGGDQKVAAHSVKDGKLLWSEKVNGRVFGFAVAGGRLFASSDTGAVQCFSTSLDARKRHIKHLLEPADVVSNEVSPKTPVLRVGPVDDERLIGHWAFQRSETKATTVKALVGQDITLANAPQLKRVGQYHALELDGAQQTLMVSPEFRQAKVPTREFTAEAWVRIDQLQEWGGIVGVIQDNGSFERGWLLGYRKNKFCVAVCAEEGPQNLTYLTANSDFQVEQWNHVAGSYDGETMNLYVNGKLAATSTAQKGPIQYPDRAWFEIGAYHDKDEYYRMRGGIHEVQLYGASLSADEVAKHFADSRSRFPERVEEVNVASGPWLQFTSPTTADVRWTTATPQPTHLEFGTDDFDKPITDFALKTEHKIELTRLGRKQMYQYRIGIDVAGNTQYTEGFECDTFFNYSPPIVDRIHGELSAEQNTLAKELLDQATTRRGMCLLAGEITSPLLLELARHSQLRFVVVETDAERVKSLRSDLLDYGIYGNQIAVHQVAQLDKLPFVGNWANLVIGLSIKDQSVAAELQRAVRPDGGVGLLVEPAKQAIPDSFGLIESDENRPWYQFVHAPLEGAGDWSHLYGTPDNSAFAGESLGGAKTTDDLGVQWVGRPGPRYQADRSGRKPSPLSTAGRLFLQGLHRIIAIDSFNGTVIWSLEIPGLERFNMPRDSSNWCADREFLYVAVKQECWKIDAVTGDVVKRFPVNATDKSPLDRGYIATHDGQLFGSDVRAGTSWTSYWGGGDAGWYDARSGAVTHPICSDRLFCRDAASGNLVWERRSGVALNSTITISDKTMYVVESRNPEVVAADERRVGDPKLWQDLYLVAIDTSTGYQRWEQKLEPMGQQVVFYLAHAAGQLTLVSSSNSSYQVKSFDDKDGKERWKQTTGWPGGKGDHGKAMSRPAIVGDRLFIRPAVLSVKDGSVLPVSMPGGGCGTYAATAGALFFRASTVTMWDPETAGKSTWPRLRPDCWLSTIPAGGMLLSPEGGGGCSCGSWMETSIGFMPKVFELK
jgi:outer membrane protein assembly factor BamB